MSQDPARIMVDFLKLLCDPTSDSVKIVNYIEHFNISADVLLPMPNSDAQIPLIYYVCSNPKMTDLFFYLIDKQVNLTASIISSEPNNSIELLYYSHPQYIPCLVEHKCQLDPQKIEQNVEKMLINGNIYKVTVLHKYHAITKEQLKTTINRDGLIFKVLDKLYEKVFMLCKRITNKPEFDKMYGDVMDMYLKTFGLFFKNGVNIDQMDPVYGESFVQRVMNTYLIELNQMLMTYHATIIGNHLLHYSNFDQSNRQVMKYIYNEETYGKLKELISSQTVTKKVIKRKCLHKMLQVNT